MNQISQQLIELYQKDFPLTPTPYADIADKLGVSEQRVISELTRLEENGTISRVGPVFNHCKAGSSTLAAMQVPEGDLQRVADIVSSFNEVNHNYEREHAINLWFVVTAPNRPTLLRVIAEIEQITGYQILNLSMEKPYHIDLGFQVLWD